MEVRTEPGNIALLQVLQVWNVRTGPAINALLKVLQVWKFRTVPGITALLQVAQVWKSGLDQVYCSAPGVICVEVRTEPGITALFQVLQVWKSGLDQVLLLCSRCYMCGSQDWTRYYCSAPGVIGVECQV